MINEHFKEHLQRNLSAGVRADGRGLLDFRKLTIEQGISSTAHGSARVRAGNAEIIAGVKFELGTPYPDSPDSGSLMVSSEMLPLSNRKFEAGPPGIDSIEYSRVIDRTIRESGTIDTKKLCVVPGEKVWTVIIDLVPVTFDGNMIDLGAIAALAALKDARLPKLDKDNNPLYEDLSDTPLPIKGTPVAVTVFKYGNILLVDPTNREEKYYDARLTVATLEDGSPCALQKGGKAPLTIDEIEKMVKISQDLGKHIREVLSL